MARWPARGNGSQLWLRVVSALVIAPPALAAVHFGSPYVQFLVLVAGAGVAWEWARLCGAGRLDRTGWLFVAVVLGALLAGALGHYAAAAWIAGAGAAGTGLIRLALRRRGAGWYAFGVLYLSIAGLGMTWLRLVPDEGLATVYWILAVVWATDTGAYVAGRTLGGPKLAPKLSPKKTWAGFAGGSAAGAIVGALAGALWPEREPVLMVAASTGLALIAQAGDLFESGLKRRFGAKDSSQLIPGHGGLLDLVDGFLAVCLVVSLMYWIAAA